MKDTNRESESKEKFLLNIAAALFVCLLAAALIKVTPAAAGTDLTVSENKTLRSKFNKYDNVTVKKGVTLTLAEIPGEPVGLEVAKKLVVEEGAKITGYGLIIFDRNASFEGIDLYYKYNDEYTKIPKGANFTKLGSDSDYKPNFEYDKQKGIYVLMGDFKGGDPFALELNAHNVDLIKGESFTLSLAGITDGVTFKSSNKKVATVSSKGLVKAKKTGVATITVKYEGKKYTCEVRVEKEGLNQSQMFMDVGQSFCLRLNGADVKKVKTSNKKVAKISKKLVVTGVGKGSCKVYVYDTEGKKYTCTVNVN